MYLGTYQKKLLNNKYSEGLIMNRHVFHSKILLMIIQFTLSNCKRAGGLHLGRVLHMGIGYVGISSNTIRRTQQEMKDPHLITSLNPPFLIFPKTLLEISLWIDGSQTIDRATCRRARVLCARLTVLAILLLI